MPEKLRLYLDQCLRLEVAEALGSEGYDVLRASEVGQARADDFEILQHTNSERRILITLDEHFGNWVVLPLSVKEGDVLAFLLFSVEDLKGAPKKAREEGRQSF